MKQKLLFVLMLFAAFSLQLASAQDRTVSGTVTGDDGAPIVGAAVVLKGTTIGAFTDDQGKFSLSVPAGMDQLVVSYLGLRAEEVTIGTQSVLTISMRSELQLDEVVITALGISREKKSLGYATQQVGGEEVSRVKDVNFINSLSGKIAGVDVARSSTLGGSSNVIIRGYKSLTGNNQALFVVDGIIMGNDITNTNNQRTGRGGYDFGNAAMDINPEDIESINVLKGAAATALYGSRAANGVILVTTKKGSRKKGLGVSVSSGVILGSIDKTTMPVYQKEYGPGYSTLQGWYADGGFDFFDFGDGPKRTAPVYEDASYGAPYDGSLVYDWRSYYEELGTLGQAFPFLAAANDPTTFYETSRTLNNNIAIDGGSENGSYRLSYTNPNQRGFFPKAKKNRHTIAFGSTYDLTKKLTISSKVNYVLTDGRARYGTGYDNRNPNQSFRQWYSTNVDMVQQREAYEKTGRNISWNPYASLDPNRSTVPHYFDNYYFSAYENVPTDQRSRTFGNIELNYAITDWLSFLGRVSTDRYNEIQEERIAVGSVDVPLYSRYNRSFYENNVDLILSANKYFGANNMFNVSGMIGSNIRRTGVESIRATTNGGLVVPKVYSLSNSVNPIQAPGETSTLVGVNGYFARANFGYRNMLYLDLTGRYDVSSTLPADNNSFFYPSASMSFVFSEVLGDAGFMSFGKLRVNYAEVGNSAPAQALFDTYDLGTPFAGVPLASAPNTQNNANLLPENTKNIEAGIEMRFLQDRIGLDVSVYQAQSFNQILPVSVTGATGSLFKFVNAGQIDNRGVEASVFLIPIRSKDFTWTINLNWARNVNEVVSLFGDQTNLQLFTAQGGISGNATVGQPYGTIRGTNYIFDANQNVIVYPHFDSGVRFRKTAAPEVIGDINPEWKGGINNAFSYKDLTFSFLLDMQRGGQFFSLDTWYGYATGIYDNTAGINRDGNPTRDQPSAGGGVFLDEVMIDRKSHGIVTQTGTNDQGVPISDGTVNTQAFYVSDVYNSLGYVYAPNAHHIHDASFIKLREISLNYSLPQSIISKTPLGGVDVSLIGRNLWIIQNNAPYTDPEAALSAGNFRGYQSGAYPAVREYGFNVRVRF